MGGGLGKGAPPSGASGSASSWEDYLALEVTRLGLKQESDASRPASTRRAPRRAAAAWLLGRAAPAHLPARRRDQPAAMARLLAVALGCISLLYLSLSGTLSRRQDGSRRLALPR